MNTLDIIVIAVVGISALVGTVKGLIKTVFGLTSVIIAVILTLMFTPVVSGYLIENTSFDEMISEKAIELLNISEHMNVDIADTSKVSDTINGLELPGNITESMIDNLTPQIVGVLDVSNVVDYIGSSIASMAVNALVFLTVFIVISILLNAIVTLLDLISQLPVLDQMNHIGGFGVGLVLGVIVVWIGLLGLSFVISIQATTELSDLIESSILTRLFYYNNPLQNFIMNLARTIGL